MCRRNRTAREEQDQREERFDFHTLFGFRDLLGGQPNGRDSELNHKPIASIGNACPRQGEVSVLTISCLLPVRPVVHPLFVRCGNGLAGCSHTSPDQGQASLLATYSQRCQGRTSVMRVVGSVQDCNVSEGATL